MSDKSTRICNIRPTCRVWHSTILIQQKEQTAHLNDLTGLAAFLTLFSNKQNCKILAFPRFGLRCFKRNCPLIYLTKYVKITPTYSGSPVQDQILLSICFLLENQVVTLEVLRAMDFLVFQHHPIRNFQLNPRFCSNGHLSLESNASAKPYITRHLQAIKLNNAGN